MRRSPIKRDLCVAVTSGLALGIIIVLGAMAAIGKTLEYINNP